MACARRLLLLLYLLPVSLAWRPKTVFHLHKVSTTPPAEVAPTRAPGGSRLLSAGACPHESCLGSLEKKAPGRLGPQDS